MDTKEQITKIKEYADLADAGYAMLHYIEISLAMRGGIPL